MAEFRLITPIDVLFLRGNRLFGGAGEHGEVLMPPWPSVFAGAMASRILADAEKISLVTKNPKEAEKILEETAGKDFGCVFLGLSFNGKTYLPLPSDLVGMRENDKLSLCSVEPATIPAGLKASSSLPMVPVLKVSERKKPVKNLWLDLEGWKRYLSGELPSEESVVESERLWKIDSRLGIAIDRKTKTAEESRIYTTESVVLSKNCHFIVGYKGENIPKDGLLRLGGDGRGAVVSVPEDGAIPNDVGRPDQKWSHFKMILITPGIFPDGWLPPGCKRGDEGVVFEYNGFKARLLCAAIGRYGVVSGWDLAKNKPKPAQKVVPTGSVYWFEILEGDASVLERIWRESLYEALSEDQKSEFKARKREGFGRVWFGKWRR